MSLLAHSAEDPADNRAYLLNNGTARRYHSAVTESVTRISAKIAATAQPFTGITVDGLTPTVSGVDLDSPLHDAAAALDELEEVYLRDAVYFHHPRYLAHLNCPVVIPALVGEAVLSAVNSSLDTWDQSAGGTLIERRLIDWTAERIGLGEAADGIFTSGGSQSNLQAMLLARDEACRRELSREGSPKLSTPLEQGDPHRRAPGSPTYCPGCASSPPNAATSASASRPPCWAWARKPSSPSPATTPSACAPTRSPPNWPAARAPA